MCGEKTPGSPRPAGGGGSPPRVRGKGVHTETPGILRRITPACAGKSASDGMTASGGWDHPRVCGEKWVLGQMCIGSKGITPACAGKSARFLTVDASVRDHPRVCGEKPLCLQNYPLKVGSPPRVRGKAGCPPIPQLPRGSPPRVRGKALCWEVGTNGARITPACAGKRPPRRCNRSRGGDHPRVCGEKDTAP